ncbi:hypothetical protein C0J52_21462, partial [Blattella germanica]
PPRFYFGVWRIRTNSELTQLYKNPNIITLIKAKRIEWNGRVSRMDGGRSIKRSLKESLKEEGTEEDRD